MRSAIRVIALVDGEHHPSVTRWGLASAHAAGYEVVLALVVGGTEKISASGEIELGRVALRGPEADPMGALAVAIDEVRPDAILDLSDEPILAYERRMQMAAVSLVRGVPYLGPDFRFDPPITEAALAVPSLAVIGTGKRVAKTGVAGHLARLADAEGLRPIIVSMGRGGPAAPVAAGPEDVTLDALIARADRGEHAASDFLEDALTTGVPTVGARRAGGGLAGTPFVTNAAAAADLAVEMGAGLVILEGSGSSLPPVPWDSGVLVIPAALPPAHLAGYMGPLRVLLSDLAVFIIGEGLDSGPENLSVLKSHIRRLRAGIRVAVAELEPVSLAEVRGKDAFFATTANDELAGRIAKRLERNSGCHVVMVSSHLADRAALAADLQASPPFDVLLTELKGAAVDVAAREAVSRGAVVAFVDNRPRTVAGDAEVDDLLLEVARLAGRRASARSSARS